MAKDSDSEGKCSGLESSVKLGKVYNSTLINKNSEKNGLTFKLYQGRFISD